MKILKLQAENVKRLVAVEITPTGDTVVISGNNGAGKSSVLDAIFWALAGAKNIQDKPIREGQEKAFVRLDLGKYTVERRFTQKGTYLDVRTVEGAKFTDAQAVLNDLIGSIAFDPLEFARMKPADQYDVIRKIVRFDVDLDALKAKYDEDYKERTHVNREVSQIEASLAMIRLPENPPEAPIDVVEKSKALLEARSRVDQADKAKCLAQDAELILIAAQKSLALAEKSVVEAEVNLSNAKTDHNLKETLRPTEEQLASIENDISTANEKNAEWIRVVNKKDMEKKLEAAKATADLLTEKLEGYKAQKENAFAAAKWPVPGLTITDGAVYYNGIPFDQASSAEQLRVSAAIAMSGNSELRVMRIKDGSLLDPNGFKILEEMAKEHDYQVWVETCYTDDPMAIIIEDGSVKGAEIKNTDKE